MCLIEIKRSMFEIKRSKRLMFFSFYCVLVLISFVLHRACIPDGSVPSFFSLPPPPERTRCTALSTLRSW